MANLSFRLITMLGLLTLITLVGLLIDYLRLVRHPFRLGLWLAFSSIVLGLILTYHALLPDNHLYGQVFSKTKTDQKVVALTFDDGPYLPYTAQILDVLQEYQVTATFFIIGQNAAKHPQLIDRILAEGHQLGNHTWQHLDLLKVDREVIEQEVDRTTRLIKRLTGQQPIAVRPPHGFRDPLVMDVMAQKGLQVVEWSVLARDWTNPGVDVIVRRIVHNVTSGSIILLHDGDGVQQAAPRAQTVEATRHIVRELTHQGYRFVTVQDMLKNGRSK